LKNQPIAIVGMSCRLPGANDIHQFWDLMIQGKNAVAPVPATRLNRELYFNPKVGTRGCSYSDLAALVDYSDAEVIDDLITAHDLQNHDPAHLTLLRVVRDAMNHAGISAAAWKGRQVGTFIGHTTASMLGGDYVYGTHIPQVADYLRETNLSDLLPSGASQQIMQQLTEQVRSQFPWRTRERNPQLAVGHAARLVSKKFGLNGPSMIFNSACASSLQAIGHGMKSLQLGRVEAAIVGGASCFSSDTLVLFSAAQSLSAEGSFPFTEQAQGLIVGEGYVVFVLKTLEKALADHDTIHAVLSGVGISSDGSGMSLWAPRMEGQIEAVQRAYGDQVDVSTLDYVEGHATSTHLGDKTELATLTQILKGKLPAGKSIPIGSVKRNIGHCLEAAGAAGLLKVVLSMQQETIPPAVEPDAQLNKSVDWAQTPVYPPSTALPWPAHPDGRPRRAGVNAFGIGGLNVHLVVEDFPPARVAAAGRPTTFSHSNGHSNGTNGVLKKNGFHGSQPRLLQKREEERSVAIIGAGLVLPGVKNFDQFRFALESSQRMLKPLPKTPWDAQLFADRTRWGEQTIPIPGAGAVTDFAYDWKKHRIPPKQIAQASPLQFLILDAVDQAIQQAGYVSGKKKKDADPALRTLDHERTGCIVGTTFGGDFSTQLVMGLRLPETRESLRNLLQAHGLAPEQCDQVLERFTEQLFKEMPSLIDETGSFTSSALASRITKAYDLMGGGVAVECDDGSAISALVCSVDMLLTGSCDQMICVAGQHDLTPGTYLELMLTNRLANSIDFASPYDASASGTLPSEGGIALFLKRLSDARRDGDPILGIIEGIGVANGPTVEKTVADAVENALHDAGISKQMVRSVESVGLGLKKIDHAELKGLKEAYLASSENRKLPLGTRVGQFGHLCSASGFVSLLSAMVGLQKEALPPTIAFQSLDADLQAGNVVFSQQSQRLSTDDPQGRLYSGVNVNLELGSCFHVILQRGSPVTPVTPSTASNGASIQRISSNVVFFDATYRRRERLKANAERPASQAAVAAPVAATVTAPGAAAPAATPVAPPRPAPVAAPVQRAPSAPPKVTGVASPVTIPTPKLGQPLPAAPAPVRAPAPAPVATRAAAPAPVAPPAPVTPPPAAPAPAAAAPAAKTPAIDPAELETFLINFVIEQTGYPREIVDLDAELEADLGIDSIKKAQLFGELGEYFDVQASDDVTLDDFNTLRKVLNFLVNERVASGEETTTASEPAPPAAQASATAAPVTEPAAAKNSALDPAELETFLINFVIEQTGYPREIVDLDAELEADLGIDSIKKAQLFGELGEYFDVQASEDVTLDDFNTLRKVLNFLVNQ